MNFSLTGLGAGLFLVSLWLDFSWGTLAGWLLVILGGNATLLAIVGRADRLWLTVLNYRLSWTSRGVMASGVFAVVGFLYWALLQGWLSLGTGSASYWAIRAVAGLAALFLLILDGLIMNSSPGIPLWHTRLLLILFPFYGLLGGTAFALLMLYYGLGKTALGTSVLAWVVAGLLGANLVLLIAYMVSMYNRGLVARESADLLYRGKYAPYWLGLVIGVGLVIPLFLTSYVIGTQNIISFVGAAAAIFVGNYSVRLLLLRGGVYAPVRASSVDRPIPAGAR